MNYHINENNIPTLAVGFSRGLDLLGNSIAFARGGFKAMNDKSYPSHAFLFTRDEGRIFATEETGSGLQEKSLAEYCSDKNRIVAVKYWHGWDDEAARTKAIRMLADIRADAMLNSKYDFKGLLSFLPVLDKWFKPDPFRQWCSENCASVHLCGGAEWARKTEIAPDQLLKVMNRENNCETILGYYL